MLHWLGDYAPHPTTVNGIEQLRASLGAGLGILLTAAISYIVLGAGAAPWLIAPLGASAVLLFAVPGSPLAQPWSILGGNMSSAAIGVLCAHWIGDPVLACACAAGGAIALMFALRCLHPPGGAVALTAVLGGPAVHALGAHFIWLPVGLNSALLLLAAIAYHKATRRRYPHAAQIDHGNTSHTHDLRPSDRLGFTPADLDAVVRQYNQVLDVSRDDLEHLILQTEMHAYRRRFGEITCADIMSRDLVSVQFGTLLQDAWGLLLQHNIKALPVVDHARRVIGIITQRDFIRHADISVYEGFEDRLRTFIRKTTTMHSDKPEVVGQLMTSNVLTASTDMHIVELVPLLSQSGLHHIPVINNERRLIGIVTQSDLIAALYRGRLNDI